MIKKASFSKDVLVASSLVFSLLACSTANNFLDIENFNCNLTISTQKTSGDVILPSEVEYEFTLSSLYSSKKHYINRKYIQDTNLNPKMLVVPLHFKDSKAVTNSYEKVDLKNKIEKTFNGSEIETGYESVSTFYNKSSFGKINFDIKIADFFDTEIYSSSIKNKDDVTRLVNETLKSVTYKGEKIDINDFDEDKDGFIDSLFFIYDVPNYKNDKSLNDVFWAYTYTKDSPNAQKDELNYGSYSFASYDFLLPNKNKELKFDARTYVHELGHQFGLEDHYDYKNEASPTSFLDMMDGGLFDFDYYSKMSLNWVKPYIVFGEANINTYDLFESKSPVVVLKDQTRIKRKDDKYAFNPFNEYLLLEYFDFENPLINHDMTYGNLNIGFDSSNFITKSGFKIYHIDSQLLEVKNQTAASFYDLVNINDYYFKAIRNTRSSDSSNSETSYLSKYNVKTNFDFNLNALNEITLIAKKTEKQNLYSSLYIKLEIDENLNPVKSLMQISDDYLFHSGDEFDIKNYYSYFLNGSKNDVKLDDLSNFTTKILFK